MTTVLIAGSINIKNLNPKVKERIGNIVNSDFEVIVGDANGADSSIQECLLNLGRTDTTVYCSGTKVRNNIGSWPVVNVESRHAEGTRAFFTAKDLEMARVADFGLMIWDAKTTGTLSNVLELLSRKKKTVVFVNKEKTFITVGTVGQLESLVGFMSEHAKKKANEKINLIDRIMSLKNEQSDMFDS